MNHALRNIYQTTGERYRVGLNDEITGEAIFFKEQNMKKRLKSGVFGLLLLAGMTLTFFGCDDSPSSPVVTDTGITGVTVDPATVSVARGNTQAFTATVNGTGNPEQSVTWSVTGGGTGTSIISTGPSTGRLTVAPDETAPTLTVRATSTEDTSKSGTATVTVLLPTVSSVTVDPPTTTVAKGGMETFHATVNGPNNPPQTVTWSVTGGGAGTSIILTPYDGGVLTVALGETAQTLTVRATSTLNTAISGTANVSIQGTATVTNVWIHYNGNSVVRGRTRTFTAMVDGTGNPAPTVTWSVSGGGAGTSISQGGVLTVDANETATTLVVTATSTITPAQSATVTIDVTDPADVETGINITTAFETNDNLHLSYDSSINSGGTLHAQVDYYSFDQELSYKWYIGGVLQSYTSNEVNLPTTGLSAGIHYGLVIVTIDGTAFSRDFAFRVQ